MTLAKDFEWNPDYNNILERIASEDVVETEWTKLREMIKYKINKNISLFLSETGQPDPSPPHSFSPQNLAHGGLKLPPFPPRQRDGPGVNEAPINFMDEQQANAMKDVVYSQLHEFDGHPPFTIQRVCELCLHPKQHYNSVGKYLRAVEKTLLITSTTDAFPLLSEAAKDPFIGATITFGGTTEHAVPSTPLFSPIPFLHDDARRSKSLSPPPSPLVLGMNPGSSMLGSGQKALGLVDELDDPGPGHLRDNPTAISSVTTMPSRPLLETLDQRFVKAENEDRQGIGEGDMVLDDADDKENKG